MKQTYTQKGAEDRIAEIEEMAKQIYRPQQFTLMLIEVEIR